jgi:hypothetical protein
MLSEPHRLTAPHTSSNSTSSISFRGLTTLFKHRKYIVSEGRITDELEKNCKEVIVTYYTRIF